MVILSLALACFLTGSVWGLLQSEEQFFMIEGNNIEDRGIRLPTVFDSLQEFDLCSLNCKGKSCGCCNDLLNVIPVCGSSYIDPVDKTMEVSLKVTGQRIFSTIIPLDDMESMCQTFQIKTGKADLCVNASITEHMENEESFRVCIEVEMFLNNEKYIIVTFNCLQFKGDVIFEGRDASGSGKNIASVRVLSPLHLANELRKIMAEGTLTPY